PIDVFVLEQPSEITVLRDVAADELCCGVHSRPKCLGHRDHLRARLGLEIAGVNTADQTEADDADADALVGAENAVPGCSRQSRSGPGFNKTAACQFRS